MSCIPLSSGIYILYITLKYLEISGDITIVQQSGSFDILTHEKLRKLSQIGLILLEVQENKEIHVPVSLEQSSLPRIIPPQRSLHEGLHVNAKYTHQIFTQLQGYLLEKRMQLQRLGG